MKSTEKQIMYEDYQLEDFLADEFFVEWIKNPNDNNIHFWEKWVAEHPEKRKLVQLASDIIRRIGYRYYPELSDKSYLDIFEKVMMESPKEKLSIQVRKGLFKKWIFSFRQIAAIIVLGIIAWGIFEISKSKDFKEIHQDRIRQLISRTASPGTKLTLILEDGSKIIMNAGSELEFPKKFVDNKRIVTLKGEAFFEIKEDKNRPFIVNTGQVEVKVLGTSFNVRGTEKGDLSVALVSGKVQINDQKGNQLMLDPKEMMVFNAEGEFFKTSFDLVEITGWKDKILVFKSNSIEEVKKKIESWYGVSLEIKGKFPENWAYSGVYKDEILENVLHGISLSSSTIEFTLSGKNASLIFR